MISLLENRQKKKVFISIAVLIVSTYNIVQRDAPYREVSPFEGLLINTVAPLQGGVFALRETMSSFINNYVSNVSASKENLELRKKISELEGELFSFEELAKENKRLQKLLGVASSDSHSKVLARIVGWDASSNFKVLRINKGLNDGVNLQDAVVTADGVVGYIYRLTGSFADVLTILDSNNRVDGIIQRTRSHGVVEGYSGLICQMKYVREDEPLILGDLILTSGLGNIYPKGLRVGTISRIERETFGITQRVEVNPVVNFQQLEEVIVLSLKDRGDKRMELETLDKMLDADQGER